MKCSRCGVDADKKSRDRAFGKCPRCKHRFSTVPNEDKVTDMVLHHAQASVTGSDTYYFLPKHLEYEVGRRRLRRSDRRLRIGLGIAILAAICGVCGFYVTAFWYGAAGLSVIALGFWAASRSDLADPPRPPDRMVDAWLRNNQPERKLDPSSPRPIGGLETADLGDVSFDRVLLTDRDEYVDFLLANMYHFHYSCPVLSASGYPPAVFDDMLQRLRRNPNLQVFLMHDFSPDGLDFAATAGKKFFPDLAPAQVIDLGLSAEQIPRFKRMSRPLASFGQNAWSSATAELPKGHGVELTMFRPGVMIALLGAALHEGVPFHLLPGFEEPAALADSGGGYG